MDFVVSIMSLQMENAFLMTYCTPGTKTEQLNRTAPVWEKIAFDPEAGSFFFFLNGKLLDATLRS